MVAMAQKRSVPDVLRSVVAGLARCERVAQARIWLADKGDICASCRFRPECPDQTRCLHLVASAGNSVDPRNDYARLDDEFQRFPLGVRKIGRVGATGQPFLMSGVRGDEGWASPEWIKREGVKSVAAQPLIFRGEVLGVLAIFDTGLLGDVDMQWLRVLADHSAVSIANVRAFEEIERLRARLEKENDQLREEFRDLFEEAPIPYVYEGLDTRFIRANQAAMKVLGIKPEEVEGTFGKTLVAGDKETQSRLRAAFEAADQGKESDAVQLELRRKDNGSPVWVQRWSKPTADGKSTRTMMVDITDRVLMEREQARLQAQNDYLLEEIRSAHNFGDLIGTSPGLRKVAQQIQLVAPTHTAVLVTGESGTGKELVARAIHENSQRKGRALIIVNCGAVPDNLFESEFFGYTRGAFTGAVREKPGRFELADGGTLFLDEIGEIPLPMQAKLLRVLQEQEIERIGDTRTRKINVRIIAATNRNLEHEVEAGRFRQDLFYRLSVFPIEMPPLRERREDIAPLVLHFVKQMGRRLNRPVPRITQATLSQLEAHDWPGNVRELQNAVERALILSQRGPLQFDLPDFRKSHSSTALQPVPPAGVLLTRDELKRREHESIAAALKQTGGKIFGVEGAAALLGMKPTTLASRIKALGLNRKSGASTR